MDAYAMGLCQFISGAACMLRARPWNRAYAIVCYMPGIKALSGQSAILIVLLTYTPQPDFP